MAELPSGTVTFLFTDVEGSTRLLKQLGPDYADVLSGHHRILRGAFAAHGGSEVDNQGDSFFVAFQTAKEAVGAAVDAQRDLFAQSWPKDAQVRVRMGLHTGEPRRGDDRYVGIGVHRAARIGAAGHGGQVLLSSTTRELAEEDLPAGVTIRDLGERRLKDLDHAQHLYQLVIDGLPGEFGPLKTLDVELRRKRRRMYAGAALIGVVAAAVAIPVFAFGQGGSGGSTVVSGNAVAIIDPGSNKVSGQVPVGVAPAALAAGASGLWVANTTDETVSHIDLADAKVVGNVPLRGVPTSVAVGPNAVWVAIERGGVPQVVKVDSRFNLPGAPRAVAGDPYGDASVAVAGSGVWLASGGGLLEHLDSVGNPVATPLDIGNSPSSIAVGAGGVWAADSLGNDVARIDPATRVVAATTAVGNEPNAIVAGAGAVWVADEFDDAVVRIDPQTNAVTTTIGVGRSPTGIAAGLGGIWVANSGDGTVSRIDPQTNKVVKTIVVGGSPQGIAVAGGRVWVSVQNALVGPGRRNGGVAHITDFYPLDSLDPALADAPDSWEVEDATCAKLLNYPDRPAPAGSRPEPEVATALPIPTDGGKTYTFTIRRGFRFSPPSNAPVTAQTFKFTIERSLNPKIVSDTNLAQFIGDIVGVKAYIAGKAKHISGVSAHGNKLTVRLTQADPVILSQLATPFFCAVPLGTPVEAFPGVGTVPAAGPYYVASYNPAQGAVLRRNPNYHGARPHTLNEIDYSVKVGREQTVKDIEAGTADFTTSGLPSDQMTSLAARYGPGSPAAHAGDQRYFVDSSDSFWYLALNTSRPLFRDPNLRKAVNYALDRRALAQVAQANAFPERPTDQFLPPAMPGYQPIHAYPLTPDLAKARQLTRGHGGRAVFYTCDEPFCRSVAQLVQAELAPIGITVEIKTFPIQTMFAREGTRGEPFDIGFNGYAADYPDPSDILNLMFDGHLIAPTNNADDSYLNDPAVNRKLEAAARLSGSRRDLAYHAIDDYLTRDVVPGAALFNDVGLDFYSARIGSGCKIFQPVYGVDLAALCLKHRR